MANALDLQEQEQLDQLKAFWSRHGNLITWALTALLLAYAGWNGWQWYQRDQAAKSAAMFEELDKAAAAGEVDKVSRAFADLKERFPRTVAAQHGALVAAAVQYDKGQADAARATLAWAADSAREAEYRDIARLRLAGLLVEAKQADQALQQLDAVKSPAFAGLAADRRGDVLMAQNKANDAKAAYQAAYKALDDRLDYRRVLEAKLVALGAPPEAAAGPEKGASK